MTRKLDEMNQVLERVIKNLPDDCILFVMGDHGMTSTGDHGGDSEEELSAALYVYSKKNLLKPIKETITVNQVRERLSWSFWGKKTKKFCLGRFRSNILTSPWTPDPIFKSWDSNP